VNVNLPSARIYDVVARDRRGTLWFATLKGLAAYEGPDRVTHYVAESYDDESPWPPQSPREVRALLGEKVWCLCAARDGSLWVGYQQTPGVSRIAPEGIEHFDVDDGLCDGEVWSIAEGEPGVFWFATGAGLSRFDGVRWSCFRNEEGLGEETIWPLLPLEDGSLWMGTLGNGLVHLDPRDDAPPQTSFRHERYEAREGEEIEVAWSGVDAWYDTPVADLRFRHRLDGGAWSKVDAATSARLSPPAGTHTFEVQAIDRFGNAEDPPVSVELTVEGAGKIPYALVGGCAALLLVLGFLVGRARRRVPAA